MPTRLYFQASEVAAVSPAFDAGWTNTTGAVRRRLTTTPVAGDTIVAVSASWTSGDMQLLRQYVSDPMSAGIAFAAASNLQGVIGFREAESADNVRTRIGIRVVSEDGTTVRATLEAIQGPVAEPHHITWTSINVFPTSMDNGYTTVAGDRLVVEVGATDVTGITPFVESLLGADSAATDLAGSDTPDATKRPWVQVTPTVTFISEGANVPVAAGRGWRGVPDVQVTIDDVPVDVDEDWVFRNSAFGGYTDGSFLIPTTQVRRHGASIEDGAPVVVHTQAGKQIWLGTVGGDPSPRGDGKTEISTVGPWVEAEAAAEVLPFQLRGAGRFSEGDEDPHNYSQNDGYQISKGAGKLQFKAPKGEDFVAGQVASFVVWIPGAHWTRYAFVLNKNRDDANFSIRTRGATGPSGTLTTIATSSLGAGGPASGTEVENTSLGGDYDLLVFQILCDTDQSNLATRLRSWLTSLRVNGLADDDDMSASDVVSFVGEQLGWNVGGVISTGANVLPLVWEEPWSELLLYMADLEDHYVRRVSGGLEYAPWGETEWEVLRSYSANVDQLKELQPFNRVVVRYTTVAGKPAEVVVDADPDPFGGERVRVLDYDLTDPQKDDTLPNAVADRLINRYSKPRHAGFVDLFKTRDKSGPAAVLAGDAANVLDWDQGIDAPLRIHGMELRRTHARLSIESPVSIVQLMEEARRGLGQPRRRHKNRQRRAPDAAPV